MDSNTAVAGSGETAESVGPARLRLLGAFEVTESRPAAHGRWGELPHSARRLVAFLGLHGNVTRDFAAGSLWPDSRESHAQADLRTALWRTGSICPGLVVGKRTSLQLNPQVRVDVAELQELSRRLRVGHLVEGGGWSYGVLLPGWYDEWVVVVRERYRQLQLHALEELAEQLLTRGAYGPALDLALTAVEYEPLRQSCQHLVARIHLAEGNFAEAVRSVNAFKDLLWRELGVQPSPELLRLVTW